MSSEEFERQATKAIKELQEVFATNQVRYLALSGLVKAVLQQIPQPALKQIRENYLNEVNSQAAQLPPQYQRPEIWNELEGLLDDLVALRAASASNDPKTQPPL